MIEFILIVAAAIVVGLNVPKMNDLHWRDVINLNGALGLLGLVLVTAGALCMVYGLASTQFNPDGAGAAMFVAGHAVNAVCTWLVNRPKAGAP